MVLFKGDEMHDVAIEFDAWGAGDESTSGQPLFRERHAADYRRAFELDPAIDGSKISARMEQGVLTLTLPKSEKVKPRKIRVDD